MARAKKRTEADTEFNPSDFDPAMQEQAAAVIESVAAATEMPTGHASQHAPAGDEQRDLPRRQGWFSRTRAHTRVADGESRFGDVVFAFAQ